MATRVEFTFTTYLNGSELLSAIEALNYKGGNTRTGAGLKFVADNFFNPATSRDVPKVSEMNKVTMQGNQTQNEIYYQYRVMGNPHV